jgi:flagellar hook assembly protein FlgD
MRVRSALHSGTNGRFSNGEGMAVIGNNPAGAANQVQVVAIQDSNGRIVRTVTMGKAPAGDGTVAWDGNDSDNPVLPAGIYSFSVNLIHTDGSGLDLPLTSL